MSLVMLDKIIWTYHAIEWEQVNRLMGVIVWIVSAHQQCDVILSHEVQSWHQWQHIVAANFPSGDEVVIFNDWFSFNKQCQRTVGEEGFINWCLKDCDSGGRRGNWDSIALVAEDPLPVKVFYSLTQVLLDFTRNVVHELVVIGLVPCQGEKEVWGTNVPVQDTSNLQHIFVCWDLIRCLCWASCNRSLLTDDVIQVSNEELPEWWELDDQLSNRTRDEARENLEVKNRTLRKCQMKKCVKWLTIMFKCLESRRLVFTYSSLTSIGTPLIWCCLSLCKTMPLVYFLSGLVHESLTTTCGSSTLPDVDSSLLFQTIVPQPLKLSDISSMFLSQILQWLPSLLMISTHFVLISAWSCEASSSFLITWLPKSTQFHLMDMLNPMVA